MKQIFNQSEALPQIWVVTRHQYGISALAFQTSFRGETSGGVAKCPRFFSGSMWSFSNDDGDGNENISYKVIFSLQLQPFSLNPPWSQWGIGYFGFSQTWILMHAFSFYRLVFTNDGVGVGAGNFSI